MSDGEAGAYTKDINEEGNVAGTHRDVEELVDIIKTRETLVSVRQRPPCTYHPVRIQMGRESLRMIA